MPVYGVSFYCFCKVRDRRGHWRIRGGVGTAVKYDGGLFGNMHYLL